MSMSTVSPTIQHSIKHKVVKSIRGQLGTYKTPELQFRQLRFSKWHCAQMYLLSLRSLPAGSPEVTAVAAMKSQFIKWQGLQSSCCILHKLHKANISLLPKEKPNPAGYTSSLDYIDIMTMLSISFEEG